MPKVFADTRKYNQYKQNYNKLDNSYLIIMEKKLQLNKLNQNCRQAGKIQTKPGKKIHRELVGDW